MKTALVTLALAAMVSSAAAQNLPKPLPQSERVVVVQKDPLIAGYLSATLPGLGQMYSGHKGRGFAFLLGVGASFATAAALFEPAKLSLSDYDRTEYGGNDDGQLSIVEVTNWEEKRFEDDAFQSLSGGRQAGIIAAGAAGIGLYIWNILDARRLARDYNKESRLSFGPRVGPSGSGAAITVRF